MKTHELKTWPDFFGPVLSGEKPFECRKNDRGFAVGDILHLREYDPETKPENGHPFANLLVKGYTGRECFRRVTYVLEGRRGAFGVQAGFVVLGLEIVYRRPCVRCHHVFITKSPVHHICDECKKDAAE